MLAVGEEAGTPAKQEKPECPLISRLVQRIAWFTRNSKVVHIAMNERRNMSRNKLEDLFAKFNRVLRQPPSALSGAIHGTLSRAHTTGARRVLHPGSEDDLRRGEA